jgi:polysaccharide pyruvyl transferase WcaK-like protein
MHACLNALSGGVPAVPLAYSRKFAPLLAQLGWTYGVDLRTAADPVGDVLAALASPGLDDQVHEVRARADKSLALATELLRAAGPRQ